MDFVAYVDPDCVTTEDGGQTSYVELDPNPGADNGLFVRLHSWDGRRPCAHRELAAYVGEHVRVRIDVVDAPATAPAGADLFDVVVTFATGDPETVARVTLARQRAPDAPTAAAQATAIVTAAAGGFSREDLIEVTATRSFPGVARNLLAAHS